jgi:hypothetical protein
MFDATHLQNVQPTETVNVAEKSNFPSSNHQGKSNLKRLNIQTREHPVGALEIPWNLDFGTWNFPTNRKFRDVGLLA